jgi:nitroreductase
VIAIIAKINENHPVIPASEQWISVGAAIQNILLAAESLGFYATLSSGRKVGTKALRRAFELADDEHLVGFVSIGSASPETRDPRRASVNQVLTFLNAKRAD